ncbi:MAG TPA: hypothetical protein V6D29_06385, partial [Leptolyngbyaceae cyanobacterium]
DDEFQRDLNPDSRAGNNVSVADEPGRFDRSAADIKELHERLSDYTVEDLRQIPILPAGTRLKQGATYINLLDPLREEFTAMANQAADEGDYIVPKSQMPYDLWNRLTGVENPDRLDEGQ